MVLKVKEQKERGWNCADTAEVVSSNAFSEVNLAEMCGRKSPLRTDLRKFAPNKQKALILEKERFLLQVVEYSLRMVW